MTVEDQAGAWRSLWMSGQLGRFIVLCLGVWLHAADSLVTATVVPSIVDEIGGLPYVGWTISLYQIGAIVAGTAAAMLCHRLGVKRVQMIAALTYGAGCVIAAMAPDMPVLLGARLAQGSGGGMLISLTYVAIQQSFAEYLWGRLFGIVAGIWAAGSLLGPLIGGVFADLHAWRWAFWFFAAQAGILAVLTLALLRAQPMGGRADGKRPWLTLLTLVAATLMIARAGVVEAIATSIGECLLGVGLLLVAAILDRRSPSRLLPAQAADPRHPLGAGLMMVFALSVATTGFWAYGPLILKIMFGTDPLVSGYILAAEALAWSAATIAISGAPVEAAALLIRVGSGLVAIGAAAFAIAVPAGSLPGMVVCGLLEGIGFGLCWPSIVQLVTRLADERDRGLAAASPAIVQRIGSAVGAAATGIAANMSGLADGISTQAAKAAGFWVFAGFIPVLVVAMFGAWRFTQPDSHGRSLP